MRIKKLYVLIFLLSSCTIIKEQPKFVPAGDYTLVTLSSKYVSHTSTQLVYTVKILLLDNFLTLGDYSILGEGNFALSGNGVSAISNFGITQVNFLPVESSIVLLDQSGSYAKTDPDNLRSQLVSKYLSDCSQVNFFQLGGFSKGGRLFNEPVEFLTNGFTNAWQAPAQGLYTLAQQTGGQSNLYDAINTSVNSFSVTPPNATRNCLVLMNANDQASSLSLNSLLQNASSINMHVNLTCVDSSVNKLSAASLAMQTGGWLAVCNTPKQMVTVIGNWNRLTSGQATAYNFTVTLQPDIALSSGDEILTKVYLLNSSVNSAYLYVKIP